jgi:hypothetical protein
VAHRVIRRWRDHGELFFRTKGDGHFACDSPLRGKDVIARVLGVRRGERVVRFDGQKGRVFSRLLLCHSLAVWYLYLLSGRWTRLIRLRGMGPQGSGIRLVRRVVLLPQGLLIRLWNRTVR